MVSVPLRVDVVGFDAAVKFVVPLPLPLEPLVIVSHEALLVAVHVQPVCAVIAGAPIPPLAATD